MKQNDLQKLHDALAGMEDVLARSHGGRADDEALLEFRRMCWKALLLVDDGECQEQIDLLVQHAKDLYSECEPHRADILRDKISAALAEFRARLHAIEGGYGKRWRDLRAA
jgi:hypothetical protein